MNSIILAINIIAKLSIRRIVINSKIQKYLLSQNLDSKSQHNIRLKHTEERSYTHRIKVEFTLSLGAETGQEGVRTHRMRCVKIREDSEQNSDLDPHPQKKKKKAEGLVCQYEIHNLIRGDNSR